MVETDNLSNKPKKTLFARIFGGERLGWLFVAPSLVLFIITLGYPILYAIKLSFYDVALDYSEKFVGLTNFASILHDKWFWNSLKITLIYTFSSVSLTLLLGLAIATALNARWLKFRKLFHMLFLVPWTLSYVVIGTLWRWILNSSYGVINAVLQSLNITSQNISFLGDPRYALPMVIFVNVWRNVPFTIVMLYAGLQLVPSDQIEASLVDGASKVQSYVFVTLPHLSGVISTTTILNIIWTFIQFDLTQVLTQGGGPNHATELLSNLIYANSFKYYEFGNGAAISVLMLIIVLLLTILYSKLLERQNQ